MDILKSVVPLLINWALVRWEGGEGVAVAGEGTCSRLSVSGDDRKKGWSPRSRSSPTRFFDRPHLPIAWNRPQERRKKIEENENTGKHN